MKALLFILIIYVNQSISEDKQILFKTVPKKLKNFGKLVIFNSGKFGKPSVKSPKIKQPASNREYTVFPQVLANEKSFNVPDSPYFPLDQNYENKPRVKKVLPEYVSTSLRSKRSVDDKKVDKAHDKDAGKNSTKKLRGGKKKTDKAKSVKRGRRVDENLHTDDGKKQLNFIPKHRVKKSKLRNMNDKHGRNRNRTRLTQLRNSERLKYTEKPVKRSKNKRYPAKLLMSESVKNNKTQKRSKFVKLRHGVVRNKYKNSSRALRKKSRRVEARRLIAGRDASIEDYPYVVSIQKGREHWCAGALLNPRLVITTANCLWKSSRISRLRIRAGSRYVDRGGQEAKIQEVMKHPGWGIRRGPDNDVALMLLDRNIRFSDSVHGVDLPNRVMMPPFDDAWITSWGSERRDGVYDSQGVSLQVYHARLIERTKCNNVTQRFGVTVTDNFICLSQTGRRAPCTRDTGAPAVSDGVLWGLASWGIRKLCGTERFPAMFSYLASHSNLDFIANATRILMADERYYPFQDRYPNFRVSTTTPAPITLRF